MSHVAAPAVPLLGPVVLIGPPGAGKSAAGALAAARLSLPFVDLDDDIARAAGQSIDAIFATEGETSFRVREAAALAAALDGRNVLIAAGAGVVDAAQNRARLAQAHLIWLDVDDDTALARLGAARPWLPAGEAERRAAYRLREARRRPLRATLAHARVEGRAPLLEVAQQLAAAIAARPLAVAEWSGAALDAGGSQVIDLSDGPLDQVVAGGRVIVDAGLPHELPGLRVPGGEDAKQLASLEPLLSALAATPAVAPGAPTAGEPLIAVGGGAFLDAVGTAAALLRRGTPWIAVPTTPLAMADAGLGGKTALNLGDTKNVLGAFHAPRQTRLWLGFLRSASAAQLTDGRAEALKHSWLVGEPLNDPREIARWVRRSLAVKAGVIARDPRERGLRAALNLGHTVGHAIERVLGLSHGEAVLRGLLAALWLSERVVGLDATVAAWHRQSAAALGRLPPLSLSPAQTERALAALGNDKKAGRFVLLAALGRPVLVTPPTELIAQALIVATRGNQQDGA